MATSAASIIKLIGCWNYPGLWSIVILVVKCRTKPFSDQLILYTRAKSYDEDKALNDVLHATWARTISLIALLGWLMSARLMDQCWQFLLTLFWYRKSGVSQLFYPPSYPAILRSENEFIDRQCWLLYCICYRLGLDVNTHSMLGGHKGLTKLVHFI